MANVWWVWCECLMTRRWWHTHYVLVNPEYQGRGIAGHLVGMVKQRYHDYLYIEVMPEESKNATFYEKHGFHIMEDGVAMQICNPGERH